jgi:hypothetical protein
MYNTYPFLGENKSVLYLGADNTLYYPNGEMTIGACRAHFRLNSITADDQNTVRSIVLNFGDEQSGAEASGISEFSDNSDYSDYSEKWFSLDGRRLGGKPTTPGIYLHQGRKTMVK